MQKRDVFSRMNVAVTRKGMSLKDKQKGLTTVEYAVAGALVAAATVAAFEALGLQVGVVIDGLTAAIS